jgi:CDP-glucose 4,6-dehydratase
MERQDRCVEIRNAAQAEIRDQYLSSEKASQVLDWQPRYSLEQGLARSIAWYKDFFGRVA